MLVPSFLFGTARQVRAHVGKVITRVMRSSEARDYRAVVFTNAVFDASRIPFERSNAIREECVEYLSDSPWGTALLNSGQAGVWQTALPLRPLRPSRRAYVATLAGTR